MIPTPILFNKHKSSHVGWRRFAIATEFVRHCFRMISTPLNPSKYERKREKCLRHRSRRLHPLKPGEVYMRLQRVLRRTDQDMISQVEVVQEMTSRDLILRVDRRRGSVIHYRIRHG